MTIETEGAGKGDTPRYVNGEKFRANWERIFGGKCPKCKENSDPRFSRVESMGYYCPDCGEER